MIEIKKVQTKQELKAFVDFRYELYRDDECEVPCLFFDEMNTLNKEKNTAFDFCDAEYFTAWKNGKMVGRVAGIINHKANKRWNTSAVRFGWLDFIDDKNVSEALIRSVEDWGRSRGMTQIIGPLGFTDMDHEGMMVEGFNELGNMYSNHNFEYYPKHLEQLHFEKDNDYLLFKITLPNDVPEKFKKIADIAEKRYNLHSKKLSRKDLLKGGYAAKIFEIVNTTYKDLYGYSELSEKQIAQYTDEYIGMADPKLISAVVDSNDNDKLVGFGVSLPSFSKAMQKLKKGRLFPFGWWHMIKVLKMHKTDTVDLLLIGVLPEYRSKGANALVFNDLVQQFIAYGFKYAEAMPQMETNEKVRGNWEYFDSRQHKRLRCFKKKI